MAENIAKRFPQPDVFKPAIIVSNQVTDYSPGPTPPPINTSFVIETLGIIQSKCQLNCLTTLQKYHEIIATFPTKKMRIIRN